jgi:hypothetical protein
LGMIPNISVGRHYRSLSKLEGASGLTLFYLGLRLDFLRHSPPGVVDKLETLAKSGARIVLAFQPAHERRAHVPEMFKYAAFPKVKEKGAEDSTELESGHGKKGVAGIAASRKSAGKSWGVWDAYARKPKAGEHDRFSGLLNEQVEGLPPAISLQTLLYFRTPGHGWRILYSVENRPVLVERPLGSGSIVLLADAYLLSNEAMLKERYSGLLSWLTGNSSRVVFDEFHLGLSETPGFVTMARKYRLHYLLVGLMVLAGLFVWRNAVPFIPARSEQITKEPINSLELDHVGGLINLLRRKIGTGTLLDICLEEWEKSQGQRYCGLQEKIQEARDRIELDKGSRRDPVETYGEITRILSYRTFK